MSGCGMHVSDTAGCRRCDLNRRSREHQREAELSALRAELAATKQERDANDASYCIARDALNSERETHRRVAAELAATQAREARLRTALDEWIVYFRELVAQHLANDDQYLCGMVIAAHGARLKRSDAALAEKPEGREGGA